MQNRELVGIQYLRGVAALAVVIAHAAGMAAFPKYFGVKIANGFLAFGVIGVDIFFVISGFIITIVALSGPALRGSQSLRVFFEKRFFRIVPIMWIAIVSYFFLRSGFSASGEEIVPYLRAFFLIPYGDVDPNQIWTLRHEAIFYAIFALSFLPARQMRIILYIWFASPLIVYAVHLATGISVAERSFLGIVFNRHNLHFGIGFLIGVLRLKGVGQTSFSNAVRIHPLYVLTGLSLVLIAIGGIAKLYIVSVLAAALLAVMSGLLVYYAARVRRIDGTINRLGLLLGNASYSIYLFHPHFQSAMLRILARITPWMPPVVVVVMVTIGSVVAGIVVYLIVEKPLVRACQRLVPNRKPPLMPTPAA